MEPTWQERLEAARTQKEARRPASIWDAVDRGSSDDGRGGWAGLGGSLRQGSLVGERPERSLRSRLEEAHEHRLQHGHLPGSPARAVTDNTRPSDEMLRHVLDLGDQNLLSTYLSPIGSTRTLARFAQATGGPTELPVWTGLPADVDGADEDGADDRFDDGARSDIVAAAEVMELERHLHGGRVTCPNCESDRLRSELVDLTTRRASWSCRDCGLTFDGPA